MLCLLVSRAIYFSRETIMKIKPYFKLLLTVILLTQISDYAYSGPGTGGGGSGGPGIIPGAGEEMRSIGISEIYEIRYSNPQMPVIEFEDYRSERFDLRERMTDDQVEMIFELMDSGALEGLEFHFRDGSSMMLGQ
jgi:hypothetical protein